MNDEHPVELLPELALGVLAAPEAAAARRHLEECAACRAEHQEMARVAALLPFAAEDVGPAPAVKEGLMLRIAREPRVPRTAARQPRPTRWYGLAAAAALVLLFAGLGAGFLLGRGDNDDDEALRAYAERQQELVQAAARGTLLSGTGEAGEARAVFVHAPGSKWGYAWVEGLPELPEGKAYQAWFVAGGGYEPAETFTIRQGGVWLWAPEDLASYGAVGITVEDEDGAEQPSAEPFLVVRINEE